MRTSFGKLPFADLDNDTVVVDGIDDVVYVPADFPVTVPTAIGSLEISLDGTCVFDDLDVPHDLPADGVTVEILRINIRGTDGEGNTGWVERWWTVTGGVVVDNTAPVVSGSGSPAASTISTYSDTVSVDEANSTLYHQVMLNSVTSPTTPAQMLAGLDGANNPTVTGVRSQLVSSTGAQAISGGGLSENTAYKIAYMAADQKPNNSNILIRGPFTTPTTGVSTGITPDTTVASLAALYTLIDDLQTNWDTAAVANGGVAGQPLVVGMTGVFSTFSRSNKTLAHRLTIVPSSGDYSAEFDRVVMVNCDNIVFRRVKIGGPSTTLRRIDMSGACDSSGMIECFVEGHPTPGQFNTSTYMCYFQPGVTNLIYIDNAIIRSGNGKVHYFSGVIGGIVSGNVCEDSSDDCYYFGSCQNMNVYRNWGDTRNHIAYPGHLDGIQFRFNPTGLPCVNMHVWGNCFMDTQKPFQGLPVRQGVFISDIDHPNARAEQNVCAVGNAHGVTVQSTTASGGYNRHNTVLTLLGMGTNQVKGTNLDNANTGCNGGGVVSNSYNNVVCTDSPYSAGDLVVPHGEAAYAVHFGALRQVGDAWPLVGVGGDFSDFYPKATSPCHWDHPQPVGAYLRLKEIFVDGIHPGNAAGMVATIWNAGHNRHGRITS